MKVHQYSMLCAPILSQEAALEALKHGAESVARMRESYHRRRDYVVRRMNTIGLSCHCPEAAFYVFPEVASVGLSERDFSLRLLEEERVAIVPGTAFGPAGSGYCRASFATSYERLVEACERIERFVDRVTRGSGAVSA